MRILKFCFYLLLTGFITGCNDDPGTTKKKGPEFNLKEENITYSLDTLNMTGYIAYDENIKDKRPAVLVVHEWWGLNDYPKMRARELAKLGYVAFAIDVFGNGLTTSHPDTASKLIVPFYSDPLMTKARIDAAIERIKNHSAVDTRRIAAIGYCFGGGLLLEMARLGSELSAVVSFHGSLVGSPPNKDLLKSEILVCHGAADPFVPQKEVDQFKKQMDSINARYTFKTYPDAVHAFTNPNATEVGKKFNIPIAYNAAADTASWNDMKEFLSRTLNQ